MKGLLGNWHRLEVLMPAVVLIVLSLGGSRVLAASEGWTPPAPERLPSGEMPNGFDWVKLPSGEWLGGEVKAFYEDELEFDSDELGIVKIDRDDIVELRTTQPLTVRPERGAVVTGQVLLKNGKVTVYGDRTTTIDRDDILAVTAGLPRGRNYWSGDFSAGANYQSGNTEKETFNGHAMVMRRTVQRRLIFDYIGNYDETNGEEVENNHRFTANWDRFLTDRWFWSPLEFEYYKDKFLNIDHRVSYGITLGYDIIDTDKTTWSASLGPAYTKTWFEEVAAGENDEEDSPAAKGRTRFDHELTGDIDLWYDYRFLFANEETGGYMHRMELGATYEIIGDLDFRVSWVWDYISEPTANADGSTPDENDTQLQFGIGYTF